MIWNYIRDFIVQNITGGITSDYTRYNAIIGNLNHNGTTELSTTSDLFYEVGSDYSMGLGDWLATTLTIICMCLIVAFAIWLVIWVFKMVAHAFLLRR